MSATSREDIREWLAQGQSAGATHVVVASDDFDHSYYPILVKSGEDPRKIVDAHSNVRAMSRVMEVYALHLDWEEQLAEHRAFHLDAPPPPAPNRPAIPEERGAHFQATLNRIRGKITDAEQSLCGSFGGDIPADPGAAVQDLCYALAHVTDMLEELAEEIMEKKP